MRHLQCLTRLALISMFPTKYQYSMGTEGGSGSSRGGGASVCVCVCVLCVGIIRKEGKFVILVISLDDTFFNK